MFIIEGSSISHVIYHQGNQSVHMTDGMTVMLLSASIVHVIRAAVNHLCQTMLNQKLLLN